MPEETKKATTKKSTTKKPTARKTSTNKKTSTAKKPSSTKKTTSGTTKKASSSATKKTTSSTTKESTSQKTTQKKRPSTSKGIEALQSTPPKKPTVSTRKSLPKKTVSKSVKNDKNSSNLTSGDVKTVKKGRVKKQEELTTLEILEQAVEHEEILEKQALGKTFYLFFAIVAYAASFFYINNIVYDNGDVLQSGIFAFAAVFILFVLMLFNVPKLILNFFVLPFKRLFKQARREINKEIIFSVGKNKVQSTFNKYKSLFTLIIYVLFAGFLVYFSIIGSIGQGDKVLKIIMDAVITVLIFLVVVCSWQYLFNIIPSILDKSLDARNGFILTLSGVVLVIYIVFLFLDIVYLAEIMIFVLIIGFVALLGVNLNMIIGEINIFQNLRGRKSKAITRVVFIVFFGFHIYVILYASVVAYSIYNWEPDSFVFSNPEYEGTVITDLRSQDGQELSTVYWDHDLDDGVTTPVVPLTKVYYDHDSNSQTPVIELTEFIDEDYNVEYAVFDELGNYIPLRDENGNTIVKAVPVTGNTSTCFVYYNNGVFSCVDRYESHTYGDFLYWTVVTVSTIGYGDVHPSTEYNIAMGWGGFLGIYGLTFFALSISFVSNIAMEGVNSVREESRRND